METERGGTGAWAECEVDSSGEVIVRLHGELDIASAPSVSEEVESYLSGSSLRLVFDLRDLSFMDSSGIALLIQIANRSESVQLRNPSANVRRVLQLTGLTDRFGLNKCE